MLYRNEHAVKKEWIKVTENKFSSAISYFGVLVFTALVFY